MRLVRVGRVLRPVARPAKGHAVCWVVASALHQRPDVMSDNPVGTPALHAPPAVPRLDISRELLMRCSFSTVGRGSVRGWPEARVLGCITCEVSPWPDDVLPAFRIAAGDPYAVNRMQLAATVVLDEDRVLHALMIRLRLPSHGEARSRQARTCAVAGERPFARRAQAGGRPRARQLLVLLTAEAQRTRIAFGDGPTTIRTGAGSRA